MKYKFLLFFILGFLPLLVYSQQRWEITLGIPNKDNYLFNKVITYDNGYLLSFGENAYALRILLKVDIKGTELWRKIIKKNDLIVQLNSLAQNKQQTIVGGSIQNYPFLMSLNPCGEINWCSNYINNQYDHGWFENVVILNNGDIIALAYLEPPDAGDLTDRVFLFYYDVNGNLLWKKSFASKTDHPLISDRLPYYLTKFDGYYMITGFCYYPFPANPNLLAMRPMIIRIDTLFNEEWVLPYGVNDSVVGFGLGIIESNQNGENICVGGYEGPLTDVRVSLIMHFDSLGNELGFNLIPNESINASIAQNWSIDIASLPNSNYLLHSTFGVEPYANPYGELLLDSLFQVTDHLSHENTMVNTTRINVLEDNTYLFATNIYENPPTNYNRDILLYNLNGDLSQVDSDTTAHVYDSLCDHPIISDTIYLNDCEVITGIEEVPSPQEYYSFIKTIPISISPNPATGSVSFEMENTAYHKNIMVQVFGVNGNRVFEQSLASGHSAISTSVASWPDGLYVVVASSSTGGRGSAKFVVKK